MSKEKRIPKKLDCRSCLAICCHNLAMIIGRPENKKEEIDLKWQLQFDTVRVFIKNHRWYQLIEGKCMHLGKDFRCDIYNSRPERCRVYNPPDCELNGKYYDVMLNNPDDLDEYLHHTRQKKKDAAKRRREAAKKK